MEHKHKSKATAAGLLVAMGIIYGDIGTSPLYVMQSIIGDNPINSLTVLGGLSCIFWTLTLQTTLKYVILILRADNKGEGGIFALFALVRRHAKWLTLPAIIGGATLLADGIITPPISVSSAIEGLKMLHHKDGTPFVTDTVPLVIVILSGLFIFQIFGTNHVIVVLDVRTDWIDLDRPGLVHFQSLVSDVCVGIINDSSSRNSWFLDLRSRIFMYDGS
jgi:KUP system potassium uptake protein